MGEYRYIGTAALIAKGKAACRVAVRVSVKELKVRVISDTPVDTGSLEGTTTTTGVRSNGFAFTARLEQGGGLDYGIIVHQKWSHIGPARQVKVPLIGHRERHRVILAEAGKAAF